MDMSLDQAGNDGFARGINHVVNLVSLKPAHGCDAVVLNEQIAGDNLIIGIERNELTILNECAHIITS
jgi:hypothetical protein